MQSARKREIKVGLFVIAAVALFALLIFSVSEQSRVFEAKYTLTAYFRSVSGLVAGAPVMLAGVDVGSVEEIILQLDPSGKRVKVVLVIQKSAQEMIRKDSVARIETMGLLGDKYIEVTMGSLESPVIRKGSILPSVEPIDYYAVLSQGKSVLENLEGASDSLARILKKIDEGQGLAGAIVNEKTELKGAIDSFAAATKTLDEILSEVKQGTGTLGMLLYDDSTKTNLSDIVASIDRFMAGINEGQGTLGKLVKDERLYEGLVADIGASARLLRSLLSEMQSGEGLFARMLNKETAEPLLKDLSSAMRNLDDAAQKLNSVSQKIDSGQGTLGKLINDPSIYDDLADILRGAKKSWFIKRWIKSAQKKGAKEAAKKEKDGGEANDGDEAEE